MKLRSQMTLGYIRLTVKLTGTKPLLVWANSTHKMGNVIIFQKYKAALPSWQGCPVFPSALTLVTTSPDTAMIALQSLGPETPSIA